MSMSRTGETLKPTTQVGIRPELPENVAVESFLVSVTVFLPES